MTLIILCGIQGSGKSTFAAKLAKSYLHRQLVEYEWVDAHHGALQVSLGDPELEWALESGHILCAVCIQDAEQVKDCIAKYGEPDLLIFINTSAVF